MLPPLSVTLHPGSHMFIWPIVGPWWPFSPPSPLALARGDGCYLLSSRTHSGHTYKHTLTHSEQALTGRTWTGSRRADIVSVQTMRFRRYQSMYACSYSCVYSLKCICAWKCSESTEGEQKKDRKRLTDRPLVHSPSGPTSEAEDEA